MHALLQLRPPIKAVIPNQYWKRPGPFSFQDGEALHPRFANRKDEARQEGVYDFKVDVEDEVPRAYFAEYASDVDGNALLTRIYNQYVYQHAFANRALS